ncbi:MAG: hypothetical protein NTV68_16260, partial [Methanomicrobiales archaeon]|nr:hypothetical protein [Methanomicrobiales archaeon]
KVLDKQGNLPFIFLTAHGEEDIIQRVKGTLQYGYIKKPFKDDDLRIGIELALAKNRIIGHILTDNALYEMTLNNLPLGVIITNNEGVVIYLNEYARALTKCQDPLNFAHFREIVTIVDRTNGKSLENIYDRIKSEQSTIWIPSNSALIIPGKDSLPVTGNAAPIFDDKGGPEGMVVTLFALRDLIYFKTVS